MSFGSPGEGSQIKLALHSKSKAETNYLYTSALSNIGTGITSNCMSPLCPSLYPGTDDFQKCLLSLQNLDKENGKKNDEFQFARKKSGLFYFGAGYSFVFFTDNTVNNAYPAFDVISINFVGELMTFLGLRFSKYLALEIETSYMFCQNERNVAIGLNPPVTFPGNDSVAYTYAHPTQLTMFAFPLLLNLKYFPFQARKNFANRLFIGAGAGYLYVHESYDNVVYTLDQSQVTYPYTEFPVVTNMTNNQWLPLFRISAGFTGSGKVIGFGAEVRFNFAPIKKTTDAFVTRTAQNFNSIDLSGKIYFNP